jgi:hypothetical protein
LDLLLSLRRFISRIGEHVFLVIDGGVEQIPERQGTRDSDPKLLDVIKSLAHKGHTNLHILVASRDEKDIRLYFKKNVKEMLVVVDVKQGLGETLDTLANRMLEGTATTVMLKGEQDLKGKVERRLRYVGQARYRLVANLSRRYVY